MRAQQAHRCWRCQSHNDVGTALTEFWGLDFAARPHDPDAAAHCLPSAEDLGLPDDWCWTRGTLRDIATTATDSALGPDGIGYSFWAQAPDAALAVIDDIAELAQDGVDLPDSMHCSSSVFIPKAEFATRHEAPWCIASVAAAHPH